MLYPTIALSELEAWARENGVEYALSYPAKMLLVPTSKIHTNWLWVYKQNNTSIREIITRPTAHTLEESSAETAPLEFQQAAIKYLETMVQNVAQAIEDEEKLLQNSPPTNPILQKIWTNALHYRSTLRRKVSPRSKKDRRTQKLWLDSKNSQLQYKEETIAWCGGGNWAELVVHLDGRQHMVSCKCLNGKRGVCRLGLSALDQTIEMLTDSSQTQVHERLIKNIGTPKWEKDLQLIDEVFTTEPISRPGEHLGWRIKETKQGLDIEAVWCIQTSNGWKHRKADVESILKSVSHQSEPSDLHLLQLSKSNCPSLVTTMLHILQKHPRVFVGSRSADIGILQESQFSLSFTQNSTGIEWSIMMEEEEILASEILNFLSAKNSALWFKFGDNKFSYAEINHKLHLLIQNIAKVSKIIPSEGIASIYQRLPNLENILPVQLSESLRGKVLFADSRPIIRVSNGGHNNLRLDLKVRPISNKTYSIANGPEIIYIFNQEKQEFGHCSRDLEAEKSHASSLLQMLGLEPNADYQWTLSKPANIFRLLSQLKDLPEAHHNRIEWLSTIPTIQHVGIEDLRVDIFNNEQKLELEGAIETVDEILDLWEVLPAIRENNPYMLVKGHVWYSITDDFRKRLRTLADVISPEEQKLCVNNSHVVTLNNILTHEGFEPPIVLREKMRSIQSIILQNSVFAYTLRPYQIDGVKWMLNLKQWTTGCILADEMGLGKTVQVIKFLHEIQSDNQNKVLIVAPKSTSGHWLSELNKCLSDWNIYHYHGPDRHGALNTLFPKQCLVMTYDIMVRDIESLLEHHYSTIIFDEAQYLKNPQASRALSAKLLTADFRIALTGTPIENSLLDLWSIFAVVSPKHLGSWSQFKKRFVHPIETGQTQRLKDLQKLIDPLLLRRKKETVAFDLPAKIELNELVPLSTFERDMYEQLKKQAKQIIAENPQQAKFLVLSLLTKLRQVCCHRKLVLDSASNHSSKLNRALEIVQNLRHDKRKVLIFSQFVQLLQLFKSMLEAENIDLCYLDGSTQSQQRQQEIDRFQKSDVPVFLISLKAGGSGINLTSATEVIHLDPWWNPAVEDQASDRAHRIGQTQTVTVIRLVAEDSIETQIIRLQSEKRKIAQDLLSDSISKLSLQEINELLE